MTHKLSDTIKEARSKTFYEMEKFSQIVIDLVEELETSDLEDPIVRGSFGYDIGNLLNVIDPKRLDDIKLLHTLQVALRTANI